MKRGVSSKGRRDERGYTLSEMLTVLGILGMFLLLAVPNLVETYRNYRVKSSARGVANFLNLGRMKAVSTNTSYVTELNPAIKTQCPSPQGFVMVVYKVGSNRADQCYKAEKGIQVEAVGTVPDKKTTFKANGMATGKAPNWFLVKSDNGKRCQLVCVKAAGTVFVNPFRQDAGCQGPAYGASTTTPCEQPL